MDLSFAAAAAALEATGNAEAQLTILARSLA
jgi:hypothetical protein